MERNQPPIPPPALLAFLSRLARFPRPRWLRRMASAGRRLAAVQRAGGWSGLADWIRWKARGDLPEVEPAAWYAAARPSAWLLGRLRAEAWPEQAPRFAILLSGDPGDSPSRRASMAGLVEQTYPRWRLLRSAEGAGGEPERDCSPSEFFIRIRAGVRLEPQALARLARAVLEHDADVVFADDVVVDLAGNGVIAVRARSAFSFDGFLTCPDPGELVAVRGALLPRIRARGGGSRSPAGLLLRAIEHPVRISHVPDVLARVAPAGAVGGTGDAMAPADRIQAFLERTRLPARAAPAHDPAYCRLAWTLQPGTRAAILVPTRNRSDLLRSLIDSLERTVDQRLADIYVIDHESDEPEATAYLEAVARRHRVLPWHGPFNFSSIINQAAAALGGRYTHYLLLNNDVEAREAGWLESMLGLAGREDVGAVGAVLLYPDGSVQHAGIVLARDGSTWHAHVGRPYGAPPDHHPSGDPCGGSPASFGSLLATRDVSAVTGACLLIRADVFHQVGGLDERLAVGYGDVDLCLRVRAAGFKVLLDAQAVLFHHESATRGRTLGEPHPDDTRQFHRIHGARLAAGDPWYSPLLSDVGGQFRLGRPRPCPEHVISRTVDSVPPAPRAAGGAARRARDSEAA